LREVILKRVPEKDVEQFWKKKEEDIGEKIKGRSMAQFIGGYQNFSGPILKRKGSGLNI